MKLQLQINPSKALIIAFIFESSLSPPFYQFSMSKSVHGILARLQQTSFEVDEDFITIDHDVAKFPEGAKFLSSVTVNPREIDCMCAAYKILSYPLQLTDH